jgi:hypothetical protein
LVSSFPKPARKGATAFSKTRSGGFQTADPTLRGAAAILRLGRNAQWFLEGDLEIASPWGGDAAHLVSGRNAQILLEGGFEIAPPC